MTTERHEFWVCTDCYFAHHYGAERVERPITDRERAMFDYTAEHGSYAYRRELMGLERVDDDTVAEWFAGESDTRCEGGEPLWRIPDDAEFVADWTDAETGEGIHEFSWSSCDGCDCNLGGSRYRLAVDIDHQEVTA